MLILYIPQLVKKYERGDLPKSDWLDAMAFRKMEEIHAVSCTLYQHIIIVDCLDVVGRNREIR